MKTVGLLGGMSWESTIEYYRIINEQVAHRLGGLHSAKCVLYSFDFDEIGALQRSGDWATATQRMIAAARGMVLAGADFLLICTNTMHKMAAEVQAAIDVPLFHIADPTAARVQAAGHQRVGLLATRFTMEEDFYVGRLRRRHGLEVLIPDTSERQDVHDVIFEELCLGKFQDDSRARLRCMIEGLAERGAEAVILGCTEIGLLVRPTDSPLPLFDTAVIHAEAAAALALADELPPRV